MSIEDIIGYIDALEGTLTFKPQPGDGSPEISWGDYFFYYDPTVWSPSPSPSRPS